MLESILTTCVIYVKYKITTLVIFFETKKLDGFLLKISPVMISSYGNKILKGEIYITQ